MAYKMKKGATAMYGPKAMMEKGPMAMKPKGPSARGVMDSDTEDNPTVDIEKGKAEGKSLATAMKPKGPTAKSKQRVEQDYARNAIRDYETGKKSEARYEKKKELEVAAGEGYFSRHKWHHRAYNGK